MDFDELERRYREGYIEGWRDAVNRYRDDIHFKKLTYEAAYTRCYDHIEQLELWGNDDCSGHYPPPDLKPPKQSPDLP